MSKLDFARLRAENVALMRGYPHNLPYNPRARALAEMQQQMRAAPAKVSSIAWTPIGPAPLPNGQTTTTSTAVSGRVTAIAVHPTNPNIVYVGTAQGGVYRTLDGGTNWTPILDNALSLAVGAIAIAPSQTTTVFVGTGEANLSLDSFFGVGVYVITNAETTPTLTGPLNQDGSTTDVFSGASISSILVDPANANTVFVATSTGASGIGGNSPFSTPALGLYRSVNILGGTPTFTKLTVATANGGNRAVTDLVFEPGNVNNLLCNVYGFSAAGDGGIYRSTNALAGSPAFSQVLVTAGTGTVVKFAINKVGAVVTVLAATGESSGTLRKSTDGGATWPTTMSAVNGFCDGQCWYDMAPAINPNNAGTILLGGSANGGAAFVVKKSINGGTSFSAVDIGLHADVHAIAFAPSDTTIVYTGNDGGVWKSTNTGSTWTSLNNAGFSATQFMGIAVHPTDPYFTIGGTQDNGTPWFQPNQTWIRADFGDGGFAAIDQNAASLTAVTMYHTYFNQTSNLIGFARVTNTSSATDGGWAFLGCGGAANGIACADATLFYAPLVLGPGNPNTVYFGTDKLYRSANTGTTMPAVSQVLSAGNPVSAIAISPQDDNYRLVGLRNGGLFFTTTGANPLVSLDPVGGGSAIPDKYVGRIAFDPTNKNTAYVALCGYTGSTTASNSHVWKITNLGTTPVLTAVNSGLPDIPVNAFVIDPLSGSNLFAGTDIGVYNSTDAGTSWTVYGTGLPRVAVFGMAMTSSRVLRVATHGRGMWESNGPPLPIQLSSFAGTVAHGSSVELTWTTASEVNNFGFEVQRSITQAGDYQSIPLSFMRGRGTTNVPQHYAYTDNAPGTGKLYYRLKQYDLDGTLHYSDGIAVDILTGVSGEQFPTQFSMDQSYPNPFNPSTVIRYGLPKDADVTLEVFNTVGQRVAVLVNEKQESGYHEVTFRPTGLASGAYFYTIKAGDYFASRKLVLLK